MSKDKAKKQDSKSKTTKQTDEEFPTDWDIDAYRADYEDEEHWSLRRRFMEMHKTKFPEERLVCLAQVFFNMEFMGCKYPSETMLMVAELSKDVAKEFRENRAKKLKRTFVAASSAAEQRAKARRTTTTQQSDNSGRKRTHFDMQGDESEAKKSCTDIFEGLKYGKFVLHLYGGRNAIILSAQRCKIDFQEKASEGEKKSVEFYLNNVLLTKASEETAKLAKAKAFSNSIEILQKHCYSIKLNPCRDTVKIDKSDNRVVCGVTKQKDDSAGDKKLDESNKGYKMMKMMGWTGGGLGSKTQGREDPVGYLLKNNRAGLGNDASRLDRNYFMQMLKNYLNSEDIRELQFEPSFTKEERAMLHEIAGRINLKSASHGKDESRRLVISKKSISNETILTEVLLNKNPAYIDQYHVQVPEIKRNRFPDHTSKLEFECAI